MRNPRSLKVPLQFWVVIGALAILVVAWLLFFVLKKRREKGPLGIEDSFKWWLF